MDANVCDVCGRKFDLHSNKELAACGFALVNETRMTRSR